MIHGGSSCDPWIIDRPLPMWHIGSDRRSDFGSKEKKCARHSLTHWLAFHALMPPKKRATPFQAPHALQYGLEVSSRDPANGIYE